MALTTNPVRRVTWAGVAFITAAALILPMSPSTASAATSTLDLGDAGAYVLLANAGITNVGTSVITGIAGSNGVGAGAAYTAALGAVTGNYNVIQGSATASAVTAAANVRSQAMAIPATPGGTALTAATTLLTPGVYDAAGALTFGAGQTLTLDAQNNSDAVFIMRVQEALTFGAGDVVSLVNGANAGNVYWIVGAATTVGASTQLVGRVIASNAITLGAGATVQGQLLAINGAISLDSNVINNTTSNSGGVVPPVVTSNTLIWLRNGIIQDESFLGVPYVDGISVASTDSPTTEANASFTISAGAMPLGLSLGTNGAITGTPTVLGTYSFTVRSAFGSLPVVTKDYTMTAVAQVGTGEVVWVDSALATNPVVGTAYSDQLVVANPRSPITPVTTARFTVVAGALPPGLNLNENTGVLSGTPTTTGIHNFTIRASIAGLTPTFMSYQFTTSPAGTTSTGTTSGGTPNTGTGGATVTPVVAIVATARVIYRMSKKGRWSVVPRFYAASREIPNFARYTVVKSPIKHQSKNLKSASAKARRLAAKNLGRVNPTIKGKLWRGPARIIVNW